MVCYSYSFCPDAEVVRIQRNEGMGREQRHRAALATAALPKID